jgi:hypothetical protein
MEKLKEKGPREGDDPALRSQSRHPVHIKMMTTAMDLEMKLDLEEMTQRGGSKQAEEPRASRAEEIQVQQVLDNINKLEELLMLLRSPR